MQHKPTSNGEQAEIRRLMSLARERGGRDVFHGKRHQTRYHMGMRMEVAADGDTANPQPATLHNISAGGFGFRFDRPFEKRDRILVREWTPQNDAHWLPARVSYSLIGLSGHLIGAAFEHPATGDDDEPSVGEITAKSIRGAASSAAPPPTLPASAGFSLRRAATLAASIGATLGVVIAYALTTSISRDIGAASLVVFAVAGALLFAGTAVWMVTGRATRGAVELADQIERLAQGAEQVAEPPAAPSHEMTSLWRACLLLREEWSRHENQYRTQQNRLDELGNTRTNILEMVSHGLRGPLTSIQQTAETLANELRSGDRREQHESAQSVLRDCSRLTLLVDNLLDAQRFETRRARCQMHPQDVAKTIAGSAGVFEGTAQHRGIKFRVECPEQLPPVVADADRIAQIVGNLLSNAMHVTPAGGEVQLTIETRGGELLMRVVDGGPEIPRERWDQVFDCFDTTLADDNLEHPSTGLGLHLVQRITEAHGGRAWVSSSAQGSEYCVSLPLKSIDCNADRWEPPRSPDRVAVCDADPELAARLAQVFRERDYEVYVAHSAARLFEHITTHRPELVVTDVMIPDRSAPEFLEALCTLPHRSFRLVLHAYADQKAATLRYAVDGFVERPTTEDELIETVERAMAAEPAAVASGVGVRPPYL